MNYYLRIYSKFNPHFDKCFLITNLFSSSSLPYIIIIIVIRHHHHRYQTSSSSFRLKRTLRRQNLRQEWKSKSERKKKKEKNFHCKIKEKSGGIGKFIIHSCRGDGLEEKTWIFKQNNGNRNNFSIILFLLFFFFFGLGRVEGCEVTRNNCCGLSWEIDTGLNWINISVSFALQKANWCFWAQLSDFKILQLINTLDAKRNNYLEIFYLLFWDYSLPFQELFAHFLY